MTEVRNDAVQRNEQGETGDTREGCDKSVIEEPRDLFDHERGEVDFQCVSWQGAAILIAKLQIGLGALSLPSTFHVLGFFPGILCFTVLATITTVAGYLSGNARQYYPHVHNIGDAADILFGKGARELFGVIYYLYLTLVAGAGMLTTSVALNSLSNHDTCSMVFVAVASASASIFGTGLRSLEKVSWLSWIGVAGVVVAIWITAIGCLTNDRPAAAPPTGPINLEIRVFHQTNFSQAMSAVSSQLFALGASGTFFSVAAEMKRPELFTRSLICGQSFIVVTNIAIASIMYGKVKQFLANPALGSAGPLIKKISYGIALSGLAVTAVLWSHIAAKYWLIRILRGTRHLQSNTITHWSVWAGSMLATVIFGFIIVGVVPFFGDFLSLVGAVVNPVFTNILPEFMVLYFLAQTPTKKSEVNRVPDQNQSVPVSQWVVKAFKAHKKGWRHSLALGVACFMVLTGALIIVGGTYGTALVIQESYGKGKISGVFSRADNS